MSVHAISSMYRKFWPSARKLAVPSQFTSVRDFGFMSEDFQWRKNNDSFSPTAQFSIMSFNMLAPCYKRLHIRDQITGRRVRESGSLDLWTTRANDTLRFFQEEVFNRNTSIVALQEFWLDSRYATLFEKKFAEHGYHIKLLQRTGPKVDAVALMVKADTFEILGSENVYLCTYADRVALMLCLRHKETNRHVIIANTHLSFPHNAVDRLNQMRQMQNLTSFMDKFAADRNISGATRIILGDFNVESNSPVCDHLRNAGFYSCFEVSAPDNALSSHRPASPKRAAKVDFSVLKLLNLETPLCPPLPERITNSHPVSFISHHTHQNEDLGVDHIFVKPECEYESDRQTAEKTDSEEKRQRKLRESVFVNSCSVLPQNVPCTQWHEEFSFSDHRPVEARIVFGTRKN